MGLREKTFLVLLPPPSTYEEYQYNILRVQFEYFARTHLKLRKKNLHNIPNSDLLP